jgi:hypothetical protein
MIDKNKGKSLKVASGVQAESQKHPGGSFPVPVPHLLYRDWQKLKIDGRSWVSKEVKRIVGRLLEPFNGSAPPAAQILAEITAKNLLVGLRVEGLFLSGHDLARNALRDYVTLVNCNSANLMRLYEMAKERKPDSKTPTLAEYLEAAGKLVSVKAEADPSKPAKAEAADPAPPQPKKTLF